MTPLQEFSRAHLALAGARAINLDPILYTHEERLVRMRCVSALCVFGGITTTPFPGIHRLSKSLHRKIGEPSSGRQSPPLRPKSYGKPRWDQGKGPLFSLAVLRAACVSRLPQGTVSLPAGPL